MKGQTEEQVRKGIAKTAEVLRQQSNLTSAQAEARVRRAVVLSERKENKR